MKYEVRIKPSAQKQIDKLDKKTKEKVYRVLLGIADHPFMGKKLLGELDGQRSLRAWPYRVVYFIYKHELVVLVVDVDQRKDVY